MKNFVTISLVLVCVAAMLVVGCARMPSGQRASLITAQLAIEATSADANSGVNFPWRPADPNETAADTIDRLQFGQRLLIRTMYQANANLIDVIRWSEMSDEGLPTEEDDQ